MRGGRAHPVYPGVYRGNKGWTIKVPLAGSRGLVRTGQWSTARGHEGGESVQGRGRASDGNVAMLIVDWRSAGAVRQRVVFSLGVQGLAPGLAAHTPLLGT